MRTVVAKQGGVTGFLEFHVMTKLDEYVPRMIQCPFSSASELEMLTRAYIGQKWTVLFPELEEIESVEMGGVGFEMEAEEFDVRCNCSGISMSGSVTVKDEDNIAI